MLGWGGVIGWEATWWDAGNVLYFDVGGGYTGIDTHVEISVQEHVYTYVENKS